MNSPYKYYSYFDIDRSSSELSEVDNINKNEKFNFQDKIYWQSALAFIQLLIRNYHNFLDTAENIILNKVEIVIGPIDNMINTIPPSKALYYIARNNKLDPVGIISNPEENVVMKDNAYYSEDSDPSEHIYDSIVSFSIKENLLFSFKN